MYVYFECENGHRLKARAATAGRDTHCPRCQAAVVVPQRETKAVTDSSIVRLLTDADLQTVAAAPAQRVKESPAHESSEDLKVAPIVCPRCSASVTPNSRSCDSCGLYMTVNAGAWSSVLQTAKRYVRARRGA